MEMLVLPVDAFRRCVQFNLGKGIVVTDTDTNLADFDWPMQYETVCCPGAKAATTATTIPTTCPARVSSHFKKATFPELETWTSLEHGH